MREIEIKIGEEVIVAKLLDKEAPKHCEALWNFLPMESTVHHSKMAGGQLYFITPMPLPEEYENPVIGYEQQPGDICYTSSLQEIEIMYSEAAWEPIRFPVFARVTENLEGLRIMGRQIWLKPGQRVIVRKRGQKETPKGYKARTSGPEILRELEKRIEEIWFGPPTEVENLKHPRGGVFQYAFTFINYAYGQFHHFAPSLWILRQAAKGISYLPSRKIRPLPIESVKAITLSLLDRQALILDIYGLKDSTALFRKVSDALNDAKNVNEYCEIVDRLRLYCNKMAEAGCLDALMSWGRHNYIYDALLKV